VVDVGSSTREPAFIEDPATDLRPSAGERMAIHEQTDVTARR